MTSLQETFEDKMPEQCPVRSNRYRFRFCILNRYLLASVFIGFGSIYIGFDALNRYRLFECMKREICFDYNHEIICY
ncbi:unnamed protein product [Rhizophagus irregularis]|uniref:Uncharacterized protein n=1 Tax=Rhizophagus irregularis TaxID=588596 RepID=A0A915YPJ4_9GLOM|nr:unnamed protein product [Rhizophagus irregularis]